jgi:hypothetical protein
MTLSLFFPTLAADRTKDRNAKLAPLRTAFVASNLQSHEGSCTSWDDSEARTDAFDERIKMLKARVSGRGFLEPRTPSPISKYKLEALPNKRIIPS